MIEGTQTVANLGPEQMHMFRSIFGAEQPRLSFFSDGTIGNYLRVHNIKWWDHNSEAEILGKVDKFNQDSGAIMTIVSFEDRESDGDRWFPASFSFKIN
jgi:hypothetical protein